MMRAHRISRCCRFLSTLIRLSWYTQLHRRTNGYVIDVDVHVTDADRGIGDHRRRCTCIDREFVIIWVNNRS